MAHESRTAGGAECTPREREVLDLIVRGRTNGEIAQALGISFATAKWHVSELISKFGVDSREDVAMQWRKQRSLRGSVGRLLRALVALPVLKVAAGTLVVVSTLAGGALGWAVMTTRWASDEGGAATQMLPAELNATPAPTQPPTVVAAGLAGPPQSVPPPRCPTSASSTSRESLFELMLCPALNYPEVAAVDHGGCDLSGALLKAADNLAHIDFRGCRMDGAVLDGQVLASSSFEGVSAHGLSAAGANAPSSVFRGADLRGADFSSAVLQESDFSSANLSGADLTDAIVRGAVWKDTVCPDGTNSAAHGDTCVGTLSVSDYWPASTSAPHQTWPAEGDGGWVPAVCWPKSGYIAPHICLYSAYPQFAGTEVSKCTAPGGDFEGADLRWADLTGCDLSGANLAGADLSYAVLARANLSRANLAGAKMYDVDASVADFRGARFDGAVVSHTSLTGANLQGANLAGALFRAEYANTICPDGTNSDADDGDGKSCDKNR